MTTVGDPFSFVVEGSIDTVAIVAADEALGDGTARLMVGGRLHSSGWGVPRGRSAGAVGFRVAVVLQLDVTALAGRAGAGEAVPVGGDARVDEEDEVGDSDKTVFPPGTWLA